MIGCVQSYDENGGDYVELTDVPVGNFHRSVYTGDTKAAVGMESCDKENNNFEPRASLVHNKLQKVYLNPLQPLSNPYRVSTLDQMPVRVIPSPDVRKRPIIGHLKDTCEQDRERCLRRSARTCVTKRRSLEQSFGAQHVDTKLRNCTNMSRIAEDTTIDQKHSALETNVTFVRTRSRRKQAMLRNRAESLDDLLIASKKSDSVAKKSSRHNCDAIRESPEHFTTKLNETQYSVSPNDPSVLQFSETLTQSKLGKSKSHRHRFKLGIFMKSSKNKSKSEFCLNESKVPEDDFGKKKKKEKNLQNCGDQDRSFVRKRRLSSVRAKFHKASKKSVPVVEPDGSQPSPRKRKLQVISNMMCDTYEMETNNNEIMSLRDVLNDSDLCDEFRQFLSSEHSDENLDFWTMCEVYKSSNDRQNMAHVIQRQFLADGAPREVNLDAKIKSTFAFKLEHLSATSFDQAQDSIFRLMETDSFRRFCYLRRNKRLRTK